MPARETIFDLANDPAVRSALAKIPREAPQRGSAVQHYEKKSVKRSPRVSPLFTDRAKQGARLTELEGLLRALRARRDRLAQQVGVIHTRLMSLEGAMAHAEKKIAELRRKPAHTL